METSDIAFNTESSVRVPRSGIELERFSRWTAWAGQGSLALLDQGLIAASNFTMGILLGRWLSPQEYGSYALAFAIFLLVSLVYQATILEPQRVFGSTEYADSQLAYFRALLRIHTFMGFCVVFALGALSLLMYAMRLNTLSAALTGITVAAPCVLLLWLVRNAFYVSMSPQHAVIGSTVYCAALLTSAVTLYYHQLLSPFSSFVAMGGAALIGSGILLLRLKAPPGSSPNRIKWQSVSLQHWRYGRWIAMGSLLSWLTGDYYYPLVSSFAGISAAGDLRALLNFSLPLAQALNALSVFVVPYAASLYQAKGAASLSIIMWRMAGLFSLAAAGYWSVLIFFHRPIMHLLYGGRYTEVSSLLPLVAAASFPWNIAYVPTIALRAIRSSVSLLGIYAVSSSLAIVIGIPSCRVFGIRGALWGMVLSNVAALLVSIILLVRKLRAPCDKEGLAV